MTQENEAIASPMAALPEPEDVQSQLKYYEEKMNQIALEKKRKEKENEELRNCLNKLANELTEKEKRIEYFSKLQIDDPSAVV